MYTNFKIIITILAVISLAIPLRVRGAVLYMEPSEATHNLGDTFIQEIKLDTQGEYINAVEVHIEYPEDLLEVRDFAKANSVLTLWAQEPEYKEGQLSFIGGVPAGYQGNDGVLGKIIFFVKPKRTNDSPAEGMTAEIKFAENNLALLNDGEGTEARVETKNALVSISPRFSTQLVDEWQKEISRDSITPEPFNIEISNNVNVYGGKFFIMFSAVDKQTGIDHYEVFEYRGKKSWENKNAQSPYLLENQKLDGIIRVRAVDKAGNEAIVELRPTGAVVEEKRFPWIWVILGIFGLIAVGARYRIYRFIKRKA